MPSLQSDSGRSSSLAYSQDERLTRQNIEDLGRIIASEARGSNETAQLMVGWTVINRMKRRHLRSVSVVWQHNNYAHNHPATTISRRIAESLLSGQARDISQGATLFYSPLSMPKEGDTNLHGFDIGSGLESVDGVRDRSGKPIRNYVPGWAQDGRRVRVFNVPEKEFKFYRE
ncbi:cell wall hydrolase [Komagataeibacter europaeus]|uniref:cell wall hydrolase n=1 Tax=Komagataeibacter europaeus TaxID=33995 RepID=UPI0009D97F69|nr:cell wall hydrolase [Komagataeibacter europaeus]